MWYRFVTYRESNDVLSFDVDVMVEGPDIVLVPTAEVWHRSAPTFVRDRRDEVLARLKGIKWNRELVWEETDGANCGTHDPATNTIPGSIESTPGGRYLEQQHLFDTGSLVTFAQARTLWTGAEVKFASEARGRVTLCVKTARPNSMFKLVSLPRLQNNPRVTLEFR
ncbi:MAG: hypothetical protein ACHRHE_02100 [Tepidisphaerales bacterium]